VTATTSTTIRGVSVLSGQQDPGHVFDIALSREGIGVRHPDAPVQFMSWDRVSEWELDDCEGYVLLTLRGQGATTPLMIPDWTFDELAILMRDVTSEFTVPETDEAEELPYDASAATATPSAPPPPPASQDPVPDARESDAAAAAGALEALTGAAPGRPARHQARPRRPSWRIPVTVVLLGLLAAAVIVVLLQSAGIINWSFLGPVG
jgi:hypothetical protein